MTPHDNRLTRRATSGRLTATTDAHDVRELRGMLPALEQLGYGLDALLASASLQRADVANPDAYVSPSACAAVFAAADRQRRVANLALRLALHTPVGATPLLDYLIVSSDSVGQGLERLARYLRLVNPGIRLAIRDERDPVRVVVERASGPFEIELTVSLSIVRFMRETGQQLQATCASFTHEPDDVADYARTLQCPVRAKASWNGWALPKSAMRLPLRRRDPALRRWLERQAADMLSRVPATGDVRGDVLSVLSTACSDTRSRRHSIARSNAGTARHRRRFVRECHRRRRRSRRQLEKIVNDPAVDVRFTNANSRPAPGAARLDSELFKTVEAAVTKIYNAPTLPSMSTGATDMAQVRSPGAQCIGIGSAIDVEDQIKGFGMHSDQERLLESELYRFVRFQYEIVTALARAR